VRLRVVAVGRLKAGFARDGCARYIDRIRHPCAAEVVEGREPRRGSGGTGDRWRTAEATALRSAARGTTVALDETGRQFDSRGFARWLGTQRDRSVSEISFLVGGPDGLDESVREAAGMVWSLGTLTMPHDLARLVLCEQLYRATAILARSPYHRD